MDYGGSLENCWRRKSPVGSNPTPSAIKNSKAVRGEVAERLKATVC